MNESTDNAVKQLWRSTGPGAALIVLLTVVAYAPALQGAFLWDDNTFLTENPLNRASDGLRRIWFTTEAADYYPLTNSLGWLQWRLWGADTRGYHVVNVLLHAVNAVMVWMVLRRLQIPGAWWAGLIFALHPVNVATAAWISEQKNTLSMLFGLVSVFLYVRFREENRWGWYALSLAAFLLALLSKSAIVMLPVVLLGCAWWSRGRVAGKDVMGSAPFFVLSAGFGLITIWFQHRYRLALGLAAAPVGWASHVAVAGSVPWFYLGKALFPFRLTVIYPNWQINDSHWTSYLLGAMTVGLLSLFCWKRNTWGRPLLFGFGCFVTMLVPVLGFFHQSFYRYASVADHWQYYSIVGPIALVVACALQLGRRLDERGRSWGRMAVVGLLLLLGAATWTRAAVYADNEILWRDNVSKYPAAYAARDNLGFSLARMGKLPEAVGQFEEALRQKPDFAEAHYNLGYALAQLGRMPEAIGHLEQAAQLKPDDAATHNNLANALMLAGRLPEAVQHYQQALRLQPEAAEVHYDLGLALEKMGQTADAVAQFELALKFRPDLTDAQQELARLRAGQPSSR